jgi:DNA-binding response OmpR family regulator
MSKPRTQPEETELFSLAAGVEAMKPRVLMAASDPLHAAACRTFLMAEGIDCKTVLSGLECLAWMRQDRPDVLVLDVDLPWGSGLGVATVLCEENVLGDLPVLFLADRPGRLTEAGLTGCNSFLLFKPVSPLTVTAAVAGIVAVRMGRSIDHCMIVNQDKEAFWS